MARPTATIDFETRSPVQLGGTKGRGAWLYAKDKQTRILCLAFVLPGQDPETPSLWAPAMGGYPEMCDFPEDDFGDPYDLERLFTHIREGGLIEAHNVFFEAMIWQHIAVRPKGGDENGATGLGAPAVKDSQWRCSAARCAALALPRDLEGAGEALEIPFNLRKDISGGKVMLSLSKPRKPRKGEDKEDPWGEPIVYYKDYVREDFLTLYRYNKRDVTAEHTISAVTPPLPEREYQVWLADFRANRRGVMVDLALVEMAIKLEAQLKAEMNATLGAITSSDEYPDGFRGTERAKILNWLSDRGVHLPDSTAPTLDHLIGSERFEALDPDIQTVVRIARNINRTSVSKFKRIRECMDPDDHRVRELVLYHGAATGRWSGKGIQVQNFPKGVLDKLVSPAKGKGKLVKPGTVSMAEAVLDVMTGDLAWLKAIYGDVLSLLSSVLRGALIPSPGKVFYVADYAAIEARVVLWLAGAMEALQVFYRGEDIYCDMASGIYGYKVEKKTHPTERGFGKVAILGLGYGMGYVTFLLTLRSYDIKFTPDEALKILGDNAEKYLAWVKRRLWPEPPKADATDEDKQKFRNAKKTAQTTHRRLTDEREDPEAILAELALCKFVVDTYRKRYPEVKQLWADQEEAATRAVYLWKKAKAKHDADWEETRAKAKKLAAVGKTFYAEEPPLPDPIPIECGKVTWVVETYAGRARLFCYLPSGRRIAYNDPDVKGQKTPWGEVRLSLRFMGVHKKTKKWARMSSYGGSIVENIDQATARDMMADAYVRIDQSGYGEDFAFDLLASIHDEGLTEGDDDGIDHHKELEALMEELLPVYDGCPVAAEGARLVRYQK